MISLEFIVNVRVMQVLVMKSATILPLQLTFLQDIATGGKLAVFRLDF